MSQTSGSVLFHVSKNKIDFYFLPLLLIVILSKLMYISDGRHVRNEKLKALRNGPEHTSPAPGGFQTKKICMNIDLATSVRARHKSCFLRPDTGPCRADILQYYYDIKDTVCYRFWWGGCQGNGNRFETEQECLKFCYMNETLSTNQIPIFCGVTFDYGTCFGHYNRWAYDKITKSCRRRLYSGCGGNQNNFETMEECHATCIVAPNNTMNSRGGHQLTTCIPLNINDSDE